MGTEKKLIGILFSLICLPEKFPPFKFSYVIVEVCKLD